jgi:hypothetical protein
LIQLSLSVHSRPTERECEENVMSDALSFHEIDGQHVELLPARTVMSMFTTAEGGDAGGQGISGLLGIVLNGDISEGLAATHGVVNL